MCIRDRPCSAPTIAIDRPSINTVLFNDIIKGYFRTIFFNLAIMQVPYTNTVIKKPKT